MTIVVVPARVLTVGIGRKDRASEFLATALPKAGLTLSLWYSNFGAVPASNREVVGDRVGRESIRMQMCWAILQRTSRSQSLLNTRVPGPAMPATSVRR